MGTHPGDNGERRLLSRHILLFLSALSALSECWAAPPKQVLTVCDVVRSGERLNGNIIRVAGILRDAYSQSEDPYFDVLVDDNCKGVEIHVVSADSAFLANAPPDYRPDMRSVRRAERVVKKAATDGRELSATVEGVLYVQEKDDSPRPRHKWYPFIIVIQAVRDVKEH
jgi:hypothetical protein